MIQSALQAFCTDEDGQDVVEYTLLLSFLVLGAVGLLSDCKPALRSLWTRTDTALLSAVSAS